MAKQLPLTQFSTEYHWDCRIETLTKWLPDGRVYGWKQTIFKTGGYGDHHLLTETAHLEFMEYVAKEKSDWNRMILSRGLCSFEPGDCNSFCVIPDHLWGKPRPAAKCTEQPPIQILKTNRDECPALLNLSKMQLLRKINQVHRRCNHSMCAVCECFVDYSDSLTVCDFTGRIEMYPYVEWGPASSPQYPMRRPWEWTKKSDEYIRSEYAKQI